ncbi:macro domain-containing protein [Phyllobacterium sp. SB3]|uniref:type II toxin-antitoxin system antitoxin DNA ADP-ribosyl glycohydrolase DarG n=1 Tax=Phyllobacterium sp. SB3 TaxID=3156073 RepID=UPI0032AF20D5
MSVIFKQGDMFAERADAIVNTVNCVGVMGKGVALEFKNRWPGNYEKYKNLCASKSLRPGMVFVYNNDSILRRDEWRFLVNFPTKDHWRQKSKLSYIEDGLDDFVIQIKQLPINSVVLPPLGCGNGGLDWNMVKPILIEKLSPVDDVDFIVFAPPSDENTSRNDKMEMTYERAVLVKAFGDMSDYFGGGLTRIVMQKIVYFLQEMGVDYRMSFERNHFGPYSEDLKSVFASMERRHVIAGFSSEERETTVVWDAYKEAERFLGGVDRSRAEAVIKRASLLIEGYESPYGMELLSSVHFLAQREKLSDSVAIENAISTWSPEKGEKFSSEAIAIAYNRLKEDRLIG